MVVTALPAQEKYVLCRPRGGLNDTLCQIGLCLAYCLRHDRTLVIDTLRSGLRDDIWRYFDFDWPKGLRVLNGADPAVRQGLSGLSTRPAAVTGRLDDYDIAFPVPIRPIEPVSGQVLYLDFGSSYAEDLLVHESFGGGVHSFGVLPYLRPTPFLQAVLDARMATLPPGYIAVHLRNTDLRTDHDLLFRSLEAVMAGQDVLIATDDGALQAELREADYFGAKFHFVTSLDGTHSQPLHDSDRTTIETNLDLLTDLYAMAAARTYYFTRTREDRLSGFSGLAQGLRAHVARAGAPGSARADGAQVSAWARLRFYHSQLPFFLTRSQLAIDAWHYKRQARKLSGR